ncbi:MAG: hypothetical protein LBL71_00575 [Endomicrobium sp.]|jgi:GNAT superfamily N-acetyltransferase|nr:hypothetical protein [Endomicrobium sp.]
MKIIKVDTRLQLAEFLKFPWKIYSKDSKWVPPLVSFEKSVFSKDKNPFWLHAERQLFLACDDNGNILGRIAAILDHGYIAFQNKRTGFFGFFESIDNVQVAKALFAAALKWLNECGIQEMIGPMNPSTNDECGFLLEGFELYPSFMMPYTHEYYLNLAEQSGLKKIKELYAYDMNIAADSRLKKLEYFAGISKKKLPGLSVRTVMKDSSYEKDLRATISVYNKAWEKNWGFVPWTDEEFAYIALKFKRIIDPEMTFIASINDKPVGILIALPDYNQILKRLDGRLFPLGIFKFLRYRKEIDGLRLMVMGVVKEYRHNGIEAVMYEMGLKNALRLGYKHCELSWVLDNNIITQHTAEMMNGRIYKKYAVYST